MFVTKKPLGFTVNTCFLTVTQMLCVMHNYHGFNAQITQYVQHSAFAKGLQ